MADAIMRRSTETLLCVCYTNHALDQFLEALLSKGITSIVRIGRCLKGGWIAEGRQAGKGS